MNKSFIFYLHYDISGDLTIIKLGRGMSPHAVVRLRQRLTARKFYLDHFYYGHPDDIVRLENCIKSLLKERAVSEHGQKELFKIPMDRAVELVETFILLHQLKIVKVELEEKYSAHNSQLCPLRIPPETRSYKYLIERVPTTYNVGKVKVVSRI